ncbi:hypothetical protein ES703_108369 [subsurface metagenome]
MHILRSILHEGVEKGILHTNNALLTARAIAHGFRGFELNWLVQESEEKIEHYLDELMSILFYGLVSKKYEIKERS